MKTVPFSCVLGGFLSLAISLSAQINTLTSFDYTDGAGPAAALIQEKVLYSFGSQSGDGYYPYTGLVFDKKGNLYGTTVDGGTQGYGTIFEVTAAGTETVLYSFGSQPGDGHYTRGGLVFNAKGTALYGTNVSGGAYGYGTIFELTATGTETVLYSFGSQTGDGIFPYASLVFGQKGNLYGTTLGGGANQVGTVFELTAAGKEIVLYSFVNGVSDGQAPYAGVVFDKEGNMYGTTAEGGANTEGTAFELTAAGKETVLHSFGSQSGDGTFPYGGLVFDKSGNLYGTTANGGANNLGQGTVFELTAAGTEKVLYSFGTQAGDGSFPYAGLVIDKNDNLYGANTQGGADNLGAVFELTAAGTEKVLYSFGTQSGDGYYPYGDLVLSSKGHIYGTTAYDGTHGEGTVFEVIP